MKKRTADPKPGRESADAHGDFFYDELMTGQPDATREFFRSRLMKPKAPEPAKPTKPRK